MADFTESMKAFTDRLKTSIDNRGDSLARVHQATTDLMDGAREFLANISLEHDARAEQVHAFMSASRANRCETVDAMRTSHRDSLAAMSDEMRRTLGEATRSRVENVNEFLAASHAHRRETSRAMREGHREGLAAMREELHQTLDEANKTRLEAVGMMRETFQAARQELAADLGNASKAWRAFANRGQVAPATEPMPEPMAEPMPEPMTEAMTEAMTEPPTKAHGHGKKSKQATRSHTKRNASHAR